jgi:hypothetical protein
MLKLISLVILTTLLMGCSNVPKLFHELAKDPATVRLRLMTPWGLVELDRANPGTNNASIEMGDGKIQVGK